MCSMRILESSAIMPGCMRDFAFLLLCPITNLLLYSLLAANSLACFRNRMTLAYPKCSATSSYQWPIYVFVYPMLFMQDTRFMHDI